MAKLRGILLGTAVAFSLGVGLAIGVPAVGATYDPGASDQEIKIGNIMPYSGPLSAYATIGRAEAAYFKMVNEQGGVNGRKIVFISYDDGFQPPKTVEQTRRLIEQDEVLFMFNSLGTATNLAIRKYLNTKKIPQLFVATGATVFGDPQTYPYTMGWQPDYQTEARIFAKYILQTRPAAKIGILYQNDDSGRDYLKGFKEGLGTHAGQIVKEQSYEVTDPTVDQQILNLRNAGVDALFLEAAPKQTSQGIRKVAEIGWKPPIFFIPVISSSVKAVLEPAGFQNAKDVLSTIYIKDADGLEWKDDPGMNAWRAWMSKYYPDGNVHDGFNIYGYSVAQTLVQVLKQCGDTLTRDNVMKQAANLKGLELPLLLPGIKVETGPNDYFPLEQLQMVRWNGTRWERFGNIISGR
jgi:branched-chain amino acid transport system substrate-binding protein